MWFIGLCLTLDISRDISYLFVDLSLCLNLSDPVSVTPFPSEVVCRLIAPLITAAGELLGR